MPTKKEGTPKQNGSKSSLKAGRTIGPGESRRGKSKRTLKAMQDVRDTKS